MQNFISLFVFIFISTFSYSKPIPKTPGKTAPKLKIEAKPIARQTDKPISLNIEHPEFFGEPKDAVERLNKTIKEIWADDTGCEVEKAGGEGNYTRLLKVTKMTDLVIQLDEVADYFCPGTAHPDSYMKTYFIKIDDGSIIKFWDRLSFKGKDQIVSRIKKEAKDNVAEACLEEINNMVNSDSIIEVRLNAGAFTFTPSLSYAQRGCETPLVLTPKEFLGVIGSDKALKKIVQSLSK